MQVDNIYNHKRKKNLYNSKCLESLLFFKDFFLINHFVMTEGKKWGGGGAKGVRGGMYCELLFSFFIFKFLSVISHTDVCFINVAAEDILFFSFFFLNPPL